MPVDDIRLEIGFQTHWKTKKLYKFYGPQAVLSLIYLMLFAANNKPDGKLTGMGADDIALAADWPDAPEKFIGALSDVKYLDQDKNGTYLIHDWDEHQPWAATAHIRSQQAKKAAKIRWGKQGVNADRMLIACRPHADSNADSNAPSPNPNPISSSLRSEDKKTKTGSAKSADQEAGQDDQKPKKKKRRTWKDHLAALPESQQKRFLWLKDKYPRKDYLIDAVKAFKELDPDKDEWDQIVQGLEAWKRCRQWRDGRIQHMFRWLRKRLFEEKPLQDLPSGIKPQPHGRNIW